jgi:hypothetical protein
VLDYRIRYKPLYLGGSASDYAVIEEHSNAIVHTGPLDYDEALEIADRKNAERSAQVVAELLHD